MYYCRSWTILQWLHPRLCYLEKASAKVRRGSWLQEEEMSLFFCFLLLLPSASSLYTSIVLRTWAAEYAGYGLSVQLKKVRRHAPRNHTCSKRWISWCYTRFLWCGTLLVVGGSARSRSLEEAAGVGYTPSQLHTTARFGGCHNHCSHWCWSVLVMKLYAVTMSSLTVKRLVTILQYYVGLGYMLTHAYVYWHTVVVT